MPCYLLHMMELPEGDPYRDTDLKDLVGKFPQLYCAQCSPPQHLQPSEAARCLDRSVPCWKPTDAVCTEPSSDQSRTGPL